MADKFIVKLDANNNVIGVVQNSPVVPEGWVDASDERPMCGKNFDPQTRVVGPKYYTPEQAAARDARIAARKAAKVAPE